MDWSDPKVVALENARRFVIARHKPVLCAVSSFARTADDAPMCGLCGYPDGYPMHQEPYERPTSPASLPAPSNQIQQ